MSSLNFAPINGQIDNSSRYDYSELVEELEMDISSFPLLTIILNKLRDIFLNAN